jgi:hypothetical protein
MELSLATHSVSTSDRLMAWLANRNVYHWLGFLIKAAPIVDGKWLDESGAGETTMQFTPGVGYILWRINSNENGAWTMPNPLWPTTKTTVIKQGGSS